MKRLAMALLAAGLACSSLTRADELPANFLYDPAKANKTLWPEPVKDSGKLKYNEHRQDLSRWPSLSYQDTRPTARPQRVALQLPLNGDPARGKAIAMNTQRGNCWACHVLPGDPQGGTGGPALVNVGSWGRSDAELYQRIWDGRIVNPQTEMPPYGSNGVLTDQDIRDVVSYLQSLK